MERIGASAYAKLNLILRIVGRRPDGLHLLESLVTAIDLADELVLTPLDTGIRLACRPSLGIAPEKNLVVRAARLLCAHAGLDRGVRIALEKRIPAQAGLGGGSADAAAALVALDHLFELGTPPSELRALAMELGADVPLFLGPSPAWVEGIGERVRHVDIQIPDAFLLLLPPRGCATAEVYAAFAAGAGRPSSPSGVPESATFHNDLYPAACAVWPELTRYGDLLDALPSLGWSMTGSGSALFAAFASLSQAHEAAARLAKETDARVLVARPVRQGYNIRP